MSGFRTGTKGSQPRTLRTIAEEKGTAPAGYDGALPYVPTSGMPADAPGATQVYNDQADQVKAYTTPRQSGLDPKPFGTLKRGG